MAFSLPANALLQAVFNALFGRDLGAVFGPTLLATASFAARASGVLAIAGSLGGLYYMMRCYRIKARPFWNHWQVATAFGGSVLSLGALLAAAVVTCQWFQNGLALMR